MATNIVQDAGGSDPTRALLGSPPSPPPPPASPPTLGTTPVISTTPSPGQGIALSFNGTLSPSVAATGLRYLAADPASPLIGEFWYRADLDKLSVQTSAGVKRSAAFT